MDDIEVTIKIDPDSYKEVERLIKFLHSPNLATALYNAVVLLNTLYDYQDQGYELRLVKNGDVHRFQLPKG